MLKRELLRHIESRVYYLACFDAAAKRGHQFTDADLDKAGRAVLELPHLRAELLAPPSGQPRRAKNLIPEKAADAHFKKMSAAISEWLARHKDDQQNERH